MTKVGHRRPSQSQRKDLGPTLPVRDPDDLREQLRRSNFDLGTGISEHGEESQDDIGKVRLQSA